MSETTVKVAIIGGVSALAAAVITGAFTLAAAARAPSPPKSMPSTSAPGSPGTQSGPTPTVGQNTPTAAPDGSPIYWSGSLPITGNPGTSFDSKPPHPVGDTAGMIYRWGVLREQGLGNNTLLAPWTGTGAPTAAQCQEWTSTHALRQVDKVLPDMQICIKTNQGRYGLLRINSDDSEQLGVTATIWGS